MNGERNHGEFAKGKRIDLGPLGELCDTIDEYFTNADFDKIENPNFHRMRVNAIKLLKKQLSVKKENARALIECFWTSFYYQIMKIVRRFELSEERVVWVDMFISVLAGELSVIAKEFPESRKLINVYIGDLKRYGWTLFKNKNDLMLATFYYKKAIIEDSEFGLALNQLGLLLQESDRLQALIYFMLAAFAANKPSQAAFKNIESLLAHVTTDENNAELFLFKSCFSGASFDECWRWSSRWLNDVETKDIESKDAFSKALLLHLLCLLIKFSISKANEVALRCLCETVSQASLNCFLPFVEEWNFINFDRFKRSVRRNSSSSESDSETSSVAHRSFVQNSKAIIVRKALLGAMLHFSTIAAQYIYGGRCPLAIRSSFENVCEKLVDVVNELEITLKKWNKGLHFIAEYALSNAVVSHFAHVFSETQLLPVTYNGTFSFSPKYVGDKVLENMAKLRLDHENKQKDAIASLPVYIVPEKGVFVEKLHVIKKILAETGLIVVVCECILRSLDKEKENAGTRAAIRWIKEGLPKMEKKFTIQNGSSIEDCVNKLSANISDTSFPLVTVLTKEKVLSQDEQVSKGFIMENVDKFYERCNLCKWYNS